MTPLKLSANKVFWLLFLLFALTTIALGAIDAGLKSSATPLGIVSFEFCGFTASCEQALEQWGTRGQALAMLSLGVDYLYLLLYPGLMALALYRWAPRHHPRWVAYTRLTIGICPVISLADAVENYALAQVILHGSASGYGTLAGVAAVIKFTLLALALSWLGFVVVRAALQAPSDTR
jgi:hypothetical protein